MNKRGVVPLLMAIIFATVAFFAPFWLILAVVLILLHQRLVHLQYYFNALTELDDRMYGVYLDKVNRIVVFNAAIDILKTVLLLYALYAADDVLYTIYGQPTYLLLLKFCVAFTLFHDQVRDMHWLFVIKSTSVIDIDEPTLVKWIRLLLYKLGYKEVNNASCRTDI